MAERWRYTRGNHPPHCTCVACERTRNGSIRFNERDQPLPPRRPTAPPVTFVRPKKRRCKRHLLCLVLFVVLMSAGALVFTYQSRPELFPKIQLVFEPTPQPEILTSAITQVAEPSPSPVPTPTRQAIYIPTQPPAPAPTPIPTPPSKPSTLTGLTEAELNEYREYAFALINQARTAAGLDEVILDDNPAAQSHAEDMRANCTRGHWGTNGMKPYMRYTLAGGEQYSAENVFALDFCPDDPDSYVSQSPVEQIDTAMDLFMNSPGHRENILNPHHRGVGIGLTYRPPTIWFVQLFVGDYVEYDSKPAIESMMLTVGGRVKNGATVSSESGTLTIYYDPLPTSLTRGQLSRTYCYSNGLAIAGLRPPPGPDWAYLEDETTIEIDSMRCPDPYGIPSDAPPPTTGDEARKNWELARDSSQIRGTRQLTFPWITADEWTVDGDHFSVTADIGSLLEAQGGGVYTVLLWGEINGDRVPISEYSIFVDEKTIAEMEKASLSASPTAEKVEAPITATPTALPIPASPTPTEVPPTSTPTPTPTSTPTPTATATPTTAPTPSPTPTSSTKSGLAETELTEAREYALRLINDARTAAGLNSVSLDDNTAAQSHAEDMRANCFLSHWGSDGLKPYMRYTLAGGEQYSAENVSGIGFCPSDPNRYIAKSIVAELAEAMDGLLHSPGHRRNILNPHHRKVGIGISYQRPNLWLVQLFVGDYAAYTAKPKIENGVLTLSGTATHGAIVSGRSLGVQIYYDRSPRPLTRGQLHNTTCGNNGRIIASLREPLGPNSYYTSNSYSESGSRCNDPYDIPADVPPASSYFDHKVGGTMPYRHNVIWITADHWTSTATEFSASADLSDLIDHFGDGVYTIVIWAQINGEDVPISEYSIFIPPYEPAE